MGLFAFCSWVDTNPGFVGFRCTQPHLHFAGFIAKCETQQRPISEPSPSFKLLMYHFQLIRILKSTAKPQPLQRGCPIHRS
jgi:hypothetical protein